VVSPSSNSGEKAIAFQVKKNALEKMIDIEDTVTTPLDDFDFVIQSFHKSTCVSRNKIIGSIPRSS